MSVDEHPGSTELIDLAEASLALGDAVAAFQLLSQVDEDHRGNRWTATQVQILRLNGDFEQCRELGTLVLDSMVVEEDWPNATMVLLECARVFNELMMTQECIKFLHDVDVKLRTFKSGVGSFRAQVLTILASRIVDEGDLETASHLISAAESEFRMAEDWRLATSICWVQSEIAEYSGNVELAMDLMHEVILLQEEHDDELAMQRAILRMGWLATMYTDIGPEELLLARSWVESAQESQRGDSLTIVAVWLEIFSAHIELLLGNVGRARNILCALDESSLPSDGSFGSLHWILALCEIELGNHVKAMFHLSIAKENYMLFADDAEGREVLRRLAHLYMDLGHSETGETLLAMTQRIQRDYSWCRSDCH
jgi:ATP/maltotriose-dependent transcriptional regulator MalT